MSALARPGSPRIGLFIGVSLGLHGAALLVSLLVGAWGSPTVNLDSPIIKTRLVKLGKKRDQKLLPRMKRESRKREKKKQKTKPVAPEKKSPPKAPPPKTEKQTKPAPSRSARDILAAFKAETPAVEEGRRPRLTDLIRDTIDEGDEKGSAVGEEISGRLKATYNDKILAAIKRSLVVPTTINDAERLRLKAVLYVAIASNGNLLSARITKKSANPAFDNAVLAAAKKTSSFPAPPLSVRAFYAAGVRMNVCPVSCR